MQLIAQKSDTSIMNETNFEQNQEKSTPENAPQEAPEFPKRIAFEILSDGQTEVLIEFHGQIYRLRSTRNNKLILNK